ncbi:hypothetical protein B0J15DRAFT_518337 [Fusarium solani]|uniref:CSC1/OSCA1-like cytosolic domain-containing protein n=1 Tax=Fusarium solani TaxID=169388 RepID=A0A9P9JQZ9_FUSSL|nr:uncharacterized protein B0J15DRAFT_518337 [Fusarium solani]KAH7229946.1 hypothetical protein B0J15DRAFT_518337 [Fusarium solani]
MSVLVVAWVCFVFFLEMRVYIKWRTEEALKDLFRMFPNGVKKVWANRDLSCLLCKIARRDAVHRRLEAAETDLIKAVHKAQYKRGKAAETGLRKNSGLDTMSRQDQTSCDGRNGQHKNDRPTHRLPLFGIWWLPGIAPFTRKVDTISWCRSELARLNMEIEEDQKHEKLFPVMDSAFIQFNSQVAAHMACQSTIHHLPERMTSRIVGICPKDILWANMAVTYWGRWLRTVTTSGILFIMISFWSIPVAWTGTLSQVDQLIQGYEWFSFVEKREGLRNVVQAINFRPAAC